MLRDYREVVGCPLPRLVGQLWPATNPWYGTAASGGTITTSVIDITKQPDRGGGSLKLNALALNQLYCLQLTRADMKRIGWWHLAWYDSSIRHKTPPSSFCNTASFALSLGARLSSVTPPAPVRLEPHCRHAIFWC